jgi:hypothetical protein
MRKLLYLLCLVCPACVGTSELRELAEGIQATDTEVASLFTSVADLVDERTDETLTGLGEAAEGGLIGILGAAAAAYGLARRKAKQLDAVS